MRPPDLPLTSRPTAASAAGRRLPAARVLPPALPPSVLVAVAIAAALAAVLAGCDAGSAGRTPPIVPGTEASPREVNVILKDYQFVPSALDLVTGETVLFHFVNGGLTVHEAVIGDAPVQAAWEAAEVAHADPPPGPTPVVTVSAGLEGFRVVVESGERIDVRWTVPAAAPAPLVLGCHIPGHWERGMQAPVRLVTGGADPAPVTIRPVVPASAPAP